MKDRCINAGHDAPSGNPEFSALPLVIFRVEYADSGGNHKKILMIVPLIRSAFHVSRSRAPARGSCVMHTIGALREKEREESAGDRETRRGRAKEGAARRGRRGRGSRRRRGGFILSARVCAQCSLHKDAPSTGCSRAGLPARALPRLGRATRSYAELHTKPCACQFGNSVKQSVSTGRLPCGLGQSATSPSVLRVG